MAEDNHSSSHGVVLPNPSKVGKEKSPTDLSNPYFIHPSDHSGLVLISKPLNGDNYSSWKRSMIRALNTRNKLRFINGSILAPSEADDSEGLAIWSRCNDIIHSWIVNTCDPEIADNVNFYSTAREVWEDLDTRFSQGNLACIFEIQRDIVLHKQETTSVSTYYTRLKTLWDELGMHCETPQSEQQKVMQFLMGLNESYSAIRGQILLMKPSFSVCEAYSFIAQEEKQRHLGVASVSIEPTSVATMAVRKLYPPSPGKNERSDRLDSNHRRNGPGSGKVRPHCTYCDADGHWFQKCYKLHGYPLGHPKAKSNPGSSSARPNYFAVNQASCEEGSGYEEDDWFG
ncbi:uncharacterized protein [Typha angustifolia]|uniref:uncharacterized protein n=1 Tax=Typha angustifolia TaxID=59011 RepID=UPI003C2B277D